MEEREGKSNWDELARELGAEITSEVREREEAVHAQPKSSAVVEPVIERAPLPKKAAADWNELASELGLPPLPPEEEAPAPPPKPQRPAAREEVRREGPRREQEQDRERPPRREQSRGSRGRRDEQPRRERDDRVGDRDERGEREDRGNREDHGERGRRGGRGRGRGRDDDRRPAEDRRGNRGRRDRNQERDRRDEGERGERQRTAREFDAESEADREVRPATDEVREIEAELTPEVSAPVRPEPPKPAAVSLWHKIFGSPAEQTAKLDEEPLRAEASQPLDERGEPSDAGRFAEDHGDEVFVDEREDVFEAGEQRSGERKQSEPADRSHGRSRRRRGRGRGRGHRSEARTEEGRSAEAREGARPRQAERGGHEDRFDDGDLGDDIESDDLARVVDGDADECDEGDEAMAGAGPSRRAALQRAIPTWDEAIGYIVDSNMQARTQRPRGSREGGGGRGRGRGRRN